MAILIALSAPLEVSSTVDREAPAGRGRRRLWWSPIDWAAMSVPKSYPIPGNRHVAVGVRRHQLHGDDGVGPALVQLAGRVEEARPVAGGHRDAVEPVADAAAQPFERVVLAVRQVGLERDVVAAARRCARSQSPTASAGAVSTAGRGRFSSTRAGVLLRLGHVGLVERIDAEHVPGDRGGDLPAVELLGQIERVVDLERRRRGGRRPVSISVVGTGTRPVPRLPVDSAMSCSTHRPKAAKRSGDDDGDLVAALALRLGRSPGPSSTAASSGSAARARSHSAATS